MLVVFDLDFTLWDCGGTWCDHTQPPYSKKNNKIYDSYGSLMRLYDDVIQILETLRTQSIPIAIASRTTQPNWANNLLKLCNIDHFFKYKEIYPSSKISHFKNLEKKSAIPLNKMLFFDDEYRNIDEVSELGVTSILVRNGINKKLFDTSFSFFEKNCFS